MLPGFVILPDAMLFFFGRFDFFGLLRSLYLCTSLRSSAWKKFSRIFAVSGSAGFGKFCVSVLLIREER